MELKVSHCSAFATVIAFRFADYLSVECCADNPCLRRIADLVNEFGRTVATGRPMQTGLVFMLTSLRNHAFAVRVVVGILAEVCTLLFF